MTKKYKCRVEYLESTGTQYIDTGLKGKNNIDFDYKCIFTNLDGTAQCVGGNWSGAGTSTVSLYLGLIRTNGNFAYHYDGTQSPVVVMNTTVQDTPYSIQGHMWVGEQYMVINGTKSSVGTISSTFTSSLNMYLFGINNNGLSNPAYMKLYYCKIYDNGVLARDFIPVLDNSGRPAMYDQVSGQLFYNQGSGEFTYGRQIILVEYLESIGTQYIDTGYAFTDNFAWEIDFKGISDGCTLFGGRTSSTRTALLYQRNYGGIDKTTCPIAGYNGQETPFQLEDLRVGRHKIKMAVASNKGSVWVDGAQVYNEQTFTGTYISGTTQALFADKFGTNDYREQTSSKVYELKMWQGSTLVRDFIPCIDENLVPFMFDLVNCTVYLNAGTGQFKVGPNVEKMWSGKKLRRKLALALASLKKKRRYYCEVEYLKSSGSTTNYQWIDTGFKPTTNTKVRCILACPDMGTANNITFYGARTGAEANTNFGLLNYKGNSKIRFDRGNYNNSGSYGPLSANTFYEIVQDKNKNYVDGVSASDSTGTFANVNYNMFIFGINDNGTYLKDQTQGAGVWTESQKSFKLFQIYDNGVLVRDFIPVLDWNMTPCMYDKVTEQLFYNQGTGSFTYGREIHYVDYLESTGTQYIDTGITLTSNHSVEVDYQLTSASQNRKGIFGGLVTNGARFGALLSPSNNYLEFGYGSTNVWYQPGLPDTQRHIMKQQKNLLYFDGVLAYTFSTATFTQNFTSPLGNFTYTNYNPASAKYYSSKWWDGETLVRDFIPAIDENGVGYMFDRVSHTIYDNAGTGSFKYPAKELGYIRTTGSQYIDTGYMPNQDTKIELVGKFNDVYPGCLWATRWSQSPNYDTYGAYAENNSDGMLYIYYGRYSDGNFTSVSNATFPHRDGNFIRFIQDKNTLNFTNLGNDSTWSYTFNEATFQSTRNLTLFYFSSSAAFATKGGYIKFSKIWNNGVLVRDFIAAYKDGILGMWDRVNNVFYQNAGTGTFTTGKIVEPEYE